ncbi:MAG: DUF4440 domain-containing protein [Gemmatimonadota bacterium]
MSLLLVACGAQSPAASPVADSAAALTSLRSADSALQVAVGARDTAATIAWYADGAVMMPVAEPLVEGRAAIMEEWIKVFGIPGFQNTSRLVTADASGGMGYTRGTYDTAMMGADGTPVMERGKWVSVWKRQADGSWRIVVDIFNTDAPPPLHQESVTKKP